MGENRAPGILNNRLFSQLDKNLFIPGLKVIEFAIWNP